MKSVMCFAVVLSITAVMCGVSHAGSYDYRGVCPSPAGGKMWVDKYSFYQCECTSYAADKLNDDRGTSFNNSFKHVHWGNAANWKSAAKKAGLNVDNTPKKGAIAWWPNHVAFVESVDSGGKITVSEYNFQKPYDYDKRQIKASSVSAFLHIK